MWTVYGLTIDGEDRLSPEFATRKEAERWLRVLHQVSYRNVQGGVCRYWAL